MKWAQDTETWTTRDGRVLKITDMEPSHLKNTLAYLRRHADIYRLLAAVEAERLFGNPAELSDGVFGAYTSALSDIARPDWLENLPVVQAMKDALQPHLDRENAESQQVFLQ